MFESVNLLAIFTTGLFAGGLACMAVQGGLLATTLASREDERIAEGAGGQSKILPVLSFLLSKLIAYTILGIILGWMGEALQLTLQVRITILIMTGLFMIGLALNMLNFHPIFRYFVIQPPRFLTRYIRKQSKRKDLFAPALLGAFTIFIPCGVTQAMMALAIGTASPLLGGAIMFAFVLGTTPLFFALGYLTMKMGDVLKSRFNKIASVIIIVLAIFTINSAVALTGSFWTIDNFLYNTYCFLSYCGNSVYADNTALNPVSQQTITFEQDGYKPAQFAVKAGSKVTLNLNNISGGGCVQAFTIPSLNIQQIVPVSNSKTITFTAPDKPGKISFMCSMGMYSGIIEVI